LEFDFSWEPRHVVAIDFETYYDTDYTLRKVTTEGYVRDERFETIGVGVDVDGTGAVWMEEEDFIEWKDGVDWKQCAILAHHAHFEGLICSYHYDIVPGLWLDTMSMARVFHREVSLRYLMQACGVGEKGIEVEKAKGKHRKDFTSEEWAQYGVYCRNDVDGTRGVFQVLSKDFPEVELWLIDTTIRMFSEPTFVLNEPLLHDFLIEEKARKAELLERIQADKSLLLSNDKFAAILVSLGEDPPMKVSKAKSKTAGERVETWAFAKTDPGMQTLLEHENDAVRFVAEARVALKSTINETRAERFLRMGRDNQSIPVYLKFGGAHTFRWSGGDRQNMQNLKRVAPDGSGGQLRKALRAPPGKKVVAGDSAQIEARKLAWLAEHQTLVEAFAARRDVYSEFATEIYGRPIDRRKNPDDFIPGFVSKAAVLGLGYAMGWYKFASEMLKGILGGPIVKFTQADADSMDVSVTHFMDDKRRLRRVEKMPSRLPLEERVIHCAVARAIVLRWRNKNKPIPAWWTLMEDALAAMDAGDEAAFGPGECLQTVRHGILLPNGLVMRYPGLEYHPRLRDVMKVEEDDEEDEGNDRGGYTYLGANAGRGISRVYGGLLTENIVQALARIVVAEQMLFIEKTFGYKVATMTHDEIVLMVPEREAPLALERLLVVMKMAPSWAKGLPLSAEGGIGDSYGGIKK